MSLTEAASAEAAYGDMQSFGAARGYGQAAPSRLRLSDPRRDDFAVCLQAGKPCDARGFAQDLDAPTQAALSGTKIRSSVRIGHGNGRPLCLSVSESGASAKEGIHFFRSTQGVAQHPMCGTGRRSTAASERRSSGRLSGPTFPVCLASIIDYRVAAADHSFPMIR